MKTFYFKNKRGECFRYEFTGADIEPEELDGWLDAINSHEKITEDEYWGSVKIEITIEIQSGCNETTVGYLYHDLNLLPEDFEL